MARHTPALDVYARPYVPLELRQLNNAPTTLLECTPAPWIDFASYLRTFAGSDFIAAASNFTPPAPVEAPAAADDSATISEDNYAATLKGALQREALAQQEECDGFALYAVQLLPASGDPRPFMYWLQVPGLRESTLRIEVGDNVQVQQLNFDATGQLQAISTGRDVRHNAVVWTIDRLREVITLNISSLQPWSLRFNVSFTVQSRRLGALQFAAFQSQSQLEPGGKSWMRSMLFPQPQDGVQQRTLNKAGFRFDLCDPQLNFEQTRAVDNIVADNYGQVPYLISGPPGTGKTKTVVEAALQLLASDETMKLILCAPSDPAADTLIQRLGHNLTPKGLFRLNSPGRSFPEVPDSVMPFTHVSDGLFTLPPFPELMKKRIVVVTCRDAGILLDARVTNRDLFELERRIHSAIHPETPLINPSLHWKGLLLDEAAQAMEPEALLPLLVVSPPNEISSGQIRLPLFVMIGDQNQLGPRTASKDEIIQRSLFERVLARALYSDHPLARSKQTGGTVRPLTKKMLPIIRPPFTDLIRNYRSHPAILATPSSLFYNDTLEPSAKNTDSLLWWSLFPAKTMPLLFVDNRHQDEIEKLDGGGWYNLGEANTALAYARSILQEGLVQQHEICIMSPFSAQVRVLRMKARSPEFRMSAVNIGPLEAFQGLESRFVIVCTTRTRDRFIDQDIARGLGVIFEPRRFNVALTRAKEGLVVIGNPVVLVQDENWGSFISFCHRNGAWAGNLHDWRAPHSSKIKMSRLEKQMAYREKVAKENREVNGITRRLGGIAFGMSEEEAFYASGISAEAAVRDDDTHTAG